MIEDSQLKWKEHTQLVTKKLGASCGIVNKIKKYLPLDILKNVYYSITYPHSQYGITTWGNAVKKYFSKVQVMQNRLIKIMTKSNYRKTKLSPIYARLSVLQLDKIYQLEIIKLMYKFKINVLPECFTNYYTRNSSVYNYSTRSVKNDLYHAIRVNKTKTQQSIKMLGVKIWNDLSSEIKCSSKLGFKVFVKRVKKMLYII